MKLLMMTCPSCNTQINVPEDIKYLNCTNCGESLVVQWGKGYATLGKGTSPTGSKVAATATEPHNDDRQTGEQAAVNQSTWHKQYVKEQESKRKSNLSNIIIIAILVGGLFLCVAIICSIGSPKGTKATKTQSGLSEPIKTHTPIPSGTPTTTPTPTDTLVPSSTPTFTMAPVGLVTIKEKANLRTGPGKAYDLVGNAKKGDQFSVYAQSQDGQWLQLDRAGQTWVAASLVQLPEGEINIPFAPTLTPTPTPSETPTPNVAATASAKETQKALSTLKAYMDKPPSGTWCEQNDVRGVCVGDFRYIKRIGYTRAPAYGRYVAFAIYVKNLSDSSISVNPFDVTLVMADSRTYDYSEQTYLYWASPFDALTIGPGNSTEGGVVFLVPKDDSPYKIIYSGGWFENDIEINLWILPTPTRKPSTPTKVVPTSTGIKTTQLPNDLIVNVPSLLGRQGSEVEKTLGKAELVTPNDDNDDKLAGGEYWDYSFGKYSTMLMLDKTGIVRGFQVLDGLARDNYSLDDWARILPRFGLMLKAPPDKEAPAAIYWDNIDGYTISIVAQSTSGKPVWTVQVLDKNYAP